MMSRNAKMWMMTFLAAAICAYPGIVRAMAAPAQPAAPAVVAPDEFDNPSQPTDLNVALAHQLFNATLKINYPGGDTTKAPTSVDLYGSIYKACLNDFSISLSQGDSSKGIGFKITDIDGKGVACVKARQNDQFHPIRSSLSEIPSAQTHLDLTGQQSTSIGLIHLDPTADPHNPDTYGFEGLDGKPLGFEFKSQSDLDAAAADALREQKALTDQRLQDAYKNCQDNLDDLDIAYRAIAQLHKDLGAAFDYSGAKKVLDKKEALLKKKALEKELADLTTKIKKTKKPEDALALSDELDQFATDHPEMAEDIGKAQKDLALHVANIPGATGENFDAAQQIVDRAAGMDGVSDANSDFYSKLSHGFQLNALQTRANMGQIDPYAAYQSFYGLARTIQQDQYSDCRIQQGQQMSQGCAQSTLNYRALPGVQRAVANSAYAYQQSDSTGFNPNSFYYGNSSGYGMQNMPFYFNGPYGQQPQGRGW